MIRDYTAARNLIITGGSDFHAPVPDRELGVNLEQAHIDALLRAIEHRAAAAAA
jgi:hypothetical protein